MDFQEGNISTLALGVRTVDVDRQQLARNVNFGPIPTLQDLYFISAVETWYQTDLLP